MFPPRSWKPLRPTTFTKTEWTLMGNTFSIRVTAIDHKRLREGHVPYYCQWQVFFFRWFILWMGVVRAKSHLLEQTGQNVKIIKCPLLSIINIGMPSSRKWSGVRSSLWAYTVLSPKINTTSSALWTKWIILFWARKMAEPWQRVQVKMFWVRFQSARNNKIKVIYAAKSC